VGNSSCFFHRLLRAKAAIRFRLGLSVARMKDA
jgi:hypothetical protein